MSERLPLLSVWLILGRKTLITNAPILGDGYSGATVFLVVALLAVTWQHNVLHSGKRNWKAFDREK